MLIPFIKMQAQGNDFIVWIRPMSLEQHVEIPGLAQRICDRHFGVGADGLVILAAEIASPPRMLIYNADGSRAEMCGSALRCCTALLHEVSDLNEFAINTDSGLKHTRVIQGGEHLLIEAETAAPQLIRENMCVQGWKGTYIDAGNRHFIVETDDLNNPSILAQASRLQSDPAFNTGVNVHFISYLSDTQSEMLIWENGVGATLACGTGAASAAFAGIITGKLKIQSQIQMPGGSVGVRFDAATGIMWITGTAERVFSGEYEWKTSAPI